MTFCTSFTGTSFTGISFFDDKEAIIPAACPVAIQVAITLIAPIALWSAEMHLPPTTRFFAFSGINDLAGILNQSFLGGCNLFLYGR